jgi:adenosyl cobinamide kinase/adenosyl cobinamide phosphate guanylyltransferase
LPRGSFLTRKREVATIVEALSTSLRIALMRREKTRMTRAKEVTRKIKNHITREETIVEKLILVMNGIPEMRALVKEKGRRFQLWLSSRFPPPQGCSTT